MSITNLADKRAEINAEIAVNKKDAAQLRAEAGFIPRHTLAVNAMNDFFKTYTDLRAPVFDSQHFTTAAKLLHAINASIVYQNEEIVEFNYSHLVESRDSRSRLSQKAKDTEKTRKIPTVQQYEELPPVVVAQAILRSHTVINVCPSNTSTDPDKDVLAIYDDRKNSPTFGTYQTNLKLIRSVIRQFNGDATERVVELTLNILAESAPRRSRATNPDLIFVNNGIFDFGTKTLHDFTPDCISLAKSPVDYIPNAVNPQIVNPDGSVWDVESWMVEIASSDYETEDRRGMSELLWEIVSATVRPYVSWDKSAWFFNERGSNGKGTLLQLMRNLVGSGNYASIPLADFSHDFLLEPLVNSTAILVDENDVGEYLEKSANLKAVITNDVITINRKYKAPIAWQHFGFMVQCLNDKPALRDKSGSFFRRQCFVPFSKSFIGREQKYIKDDYVNRTDVLQYVLHRVLHMNHYELSNPIAAELALEDYKRDVDPIRDFWYEFSDEFVWDLLPSQFLYDLYRAWMSKAIPNGKPLAQRKFTRDLFTLIEGDEKWEKTNGSVYTTTHIYLPEPLSSQYDLTDWLRDVNPNNPNYTLPELRGKKFRGLIRVED